MVAYGNVAPLKQSQLRVIDQLHRIDGYKQVGGHPQARLLAKILAGPWQEAEALITSLSTILNVIAVQDDRDGRLWGVRRAL